MDYLAWAVLIAIGLTLAGYLVFFLGSVWLFRRLLRKLEESQKALEQAGQVEPAQETMRQQMIETLALGEHLNETQRSALKDQIQAMATRAGIDFKSGGGGEGGDGW